MTSNFILQNNHYTATNTIANRIEKHELPTTSHSRNASFMITGSRIIRKRNNPTGFVMAYCIIFYKGKKIQHTEDDFKVDFKDDFKDFAKVEMVV